MSGGNSYKYRPEVQARRLADLNNPEVQRRHKMAREARGLKKRHIVEWNVAWNLAGRPARFPDFDAWMEENKETLKARRQTELERQKLLNKAHAAWVSERANDGAA